MANNKPTNEVEPQFVSVRDLAVKHGIAGKQGEKTIRRILRNVKVKLADGTTVELRSKTLNARAIYTFKQGSKLLAYVEKAIDSALAGTSETLSDDMLADKQD